MRSGFGAHTMHHFVLPKLRLAFYNKHAQSTSLGPKLSFWMVSPDSVAGEVQVVRSGFGVHKMHHFVLPKLRLAFCNEHAQSISLGPKQSFWVVSRDSVAGRYPL